MAQDYFANQWGLTAQPTRTRARASCFAKAMRRAPVAAAVSRMKLNPRVNGLRRRLKPAAELICVNLHPPKLRGSYVRDIRVKYHAPLIVYALQALSAGMTAIFLGLLTNYLYDKYKVKRRGHDDSERLGKLIEQQEENIKELQEFLKTETSKRCPASTILRGRIDS
jgi:hypothetical protein